jgi:hypothetical protein
MPKNEASDNSNNSNFIQKARNKYFRGISKNLAFAFDHLNPSHFSKREGYKEFLEMPLR